MKLRAPAGPDEILADLVESTPGEEGKWFAAAKELGLYDAAIELACASLSDPRTLARPARDHATKQPAFAIEAGCAALNWVGQGFGYEISGANVWMAYSSAMKAAEAIAMPLKSRSEVAGLRKAGLASGRRSSAPSSGSRADHSVPPPGR